jgi:hypothetical protein
MSSIAAQISAFFQAHPVLAALGTVALLLALIEYFFRGITRVASWPRKLWPLLAGSSAIPRATMTIIPQQRSLLWSIGAVGLNPVTHFHGDWYVTNITNGPVFLIRAQIKSPRKACSEGLLLTNISPAPLPPRVPESIRLMFSVCPPVHRQGKPFKATLVFVDQFNNKHIVKDTVFQPFPTP